MYIIKVLAVFNINNDIDMAKYIVVADTYNLGYGSEFYVFGIFDTEEDAINWIMNNPEHSIEDSYDPDTKTIFNFFDNYREGMTQRIFKEINGQIKYVGDRTIDRAEYCERFIKKFDNKPVYVGGYIE